MKKINQLLIVLCALAQFPSCNYLDVVPDERAQEEDTYKTPGDVKGFLYSCYGYLPQNRWLGDPYWWLTAEMTAVEKESYTTFNYGDYSPTNLSFTTSTWGDVWNGVRRCYLFQSMLEKISSANVNSATKLLYKGEADFLIAYYHFISLRSYGPTIIMDKMMDQNTPIDAFPERSSYDEVVEFINAKLDEAIPNLPVTQNSTDYGRATKDVALALKSRMYLYAASPLFNGNSSMYSDFKSTLDGRHLISQTYSTEKWETSAKMTKEVITTLESAGFRLFSDAEAGEPSSIKPALPNKAQRRLQYSLLSYDNNPEVIWADTRSEDIYGIQARSVVRQNKGSYIEPAANVIVPTLQTVEQFYTKNGLPIDQDKSYDYENRYVYIEAPDNCDGNNYGKPAGKVMKLHTDREPRFYAWIGYHNGYVEMSMYEDEVPGDGSHAKKAVLIQMLKDDPHGRGNRSNTNFSVSGYVNKKWTHPGWNNRWVDYPFCLFRLAELYLNYAEALVELNRLDEAKAYLDKIRERAGIPSVDDAWNKFSKNPGFQNTQDGLREIVRQERLNELYLEGHKFFDIRRWKVAEKYLGMPDRGLNTLATTVEEFYPVDLPLKRSFHKGQYLMPINQDEINKAPQLIQNPHY